MQVSMCSQQCRIVGSCLLPAALALSACTATASCAVPLCLLMQDQSYFLRNTHLQQVKSLSELWGQLRGS